MKILVIEGKKEIIDAVTLSLLIEWPDVEITAVNGTDTARESLDQGLPDVILIGADIPEQSVLENLKTIREITSTPVIILTDSSDENKVLQCLNAGANDFVTLPFTRVEIATRIKQHIHYSHETRELAPLEFGMMKYDSANQNFYCYGKKLDLTPTERDILYYLVKNAGTVLRHSELVKMVWGTEQPNPAKTLKVHIHHLRDKLVETCTQAKDNHVIQTWPNLGYSIGVPE